MLRSSYAAMVKLDAVRPGAILDGSVAERAAAHLVGEGLWTVWTRFDLASEPVAPQVSASIEELPLVDRLREPDWDVATGRVAEYLAEVVDLQKASDLSELQPHALDPTEISLATQMPTGMVRSAIDNIDATLPDDLGDIVG
jgi:hypothetical protein